MAKLVQKYKSIIAPFFDVVIFQSEKGQISFCLTKSKKTESGWENEKFFLNPAEFKAFADVAFDAYFKAEEAAREFKKQAAPAPVPDAIAAAFPGSKAVEVADIEIVNNLDNIPF